MSKLLLVNGLFTETTQDDMIVYLNKAIETIKAKRLWLDPFISPSSRTVILFDQEIDEKVFYKCTRQIDSVFKGKPFYVESVSTTESIVVKTNGAVKFGIPDKLQLIFSSKKLGGKKVNQVQLIKEDFFEVFFEKGWDAVLAVCEHSWAANNIKLIIGPYFDCYKEPVQHQFIRLQTSNIRFKETESEFQKQSSARTSIIAKKNGILETVKMIEPSVNKKEHKVPKKVVPSKKSTYFFQSKVFPMILNVLNFKAAVQSCYPDVTIDIDLLELEAEIEGPETLIKALHQSIFNEELQVSFNAYEVEFLTSMKVQEYLKVFVQDKKYKCQLLTTISSPNILITDESDKNLALQEFVSSLVIEKVCCTWPSHDFLGNDWTHFVNSFHSEHAYCQILIHNGMVHLVSIADEKIDIASLADLVRRNVVPDKTYPNFKEKNEIQAGNDFQFKDKTPALKENSDTSVEQCLSKSNVKDKCICKNNIFVWLLKRLNFEKAVSLQCSSIKVFYNENNCEINFEGQSYEVNIIKDLILSEDAKVTLTRDEKLFLEDQQVKQQLESTIINWKWQILLVNNIIIVDGQFLNRMTFNNFITTVVVRKNSLQLSSASLHDSIEWLSICESFRADYPTFYLSKNDDDEEFTLLSVPTDYPKEEDLLCKITDHLQSLLNAAELEDQMMVSLKKNLDKAVNSYAMRLDPDRNSENSLSPRKTSFTICCQHSFFVWLLDTLHIQSTVEKEYPDVFMGINTEESELLIKGSLDEAQQVKSLIVALEGKIVFTDNEEIFLGNVEVLQYVKSVVAKDGIQIVLNREENVFELIKSKGQKSAVEEFASNLVIQTKCRPLPSSNYKGNIELKKFSKSFLSAIPPSQIFIKGRNVTLFSISSEKGLSSIVSSVNKFIDSVKEFSPAAEGKKDGQMILNKLNVHENSEIKTPIESEIAKSTTVNAVQNDIRDSDHIDILKQTKSAVDNYSPTVINLKDKCKEETNKESSFSTGTKQFYTFTMHNSSHSELLSEKRSYKILRDNDKSTSLSNNSLSFPNKFIDFHPLSLQEYEYCNNFLKHKLSELENEFIADIKLNPFAIEVKCDSQPNLNSILVKLKSILNGIQFCDRCISYPGLSSFIHSEKGKDLIKTLATSYKCLLEVPETSLQFDRFQNYEYKAIVLGTAVFEGFKIHMVLGNDRNVNVEMKIDFKIEDAAAECKVESQKSSKNILITLPSLNHFQENLLSSFENAIQLVTYQIKHFNCQSVAFSTAALHNDNGSVYIKFLSDTLPVELVKKLKMSKLNCDIYIYEPTSQAVFDAFKTALLGLQTNLEAPDEKSWDRISCSDNSKCMDYKSLKTKVVVNAQHCELKSTKTLYCYPVLPNLDVNDCPVFKKDFFSQKFLEQEIQIFKKFHSSELLVGDCLQIKSWDENSEILLYSCSHWGYDSSMAIYDAVETSLLSSLDFDSVQIVPPGLHVSPKFPKKFLAWKVFQTLDSLLTSKKHIFRQKQIVFITEDKEYLQAFQLELQKRYSQNNFLNDGTIEAGKKSHKSKENESIPSLLRNKIPPVLVSFWGTSTQSISEAESSFLNFLNKQMAETKTTHNLEACSAAEVEKILASEQDLPVSICLEKKKKQKKHKTGRKKQNENVSYTLCIQSLNSHFVKDFEEHILGSK